MKSVEKVSNSIFYAIGLAEYGCGDAGLSMASEVKESFLLKPLITWRSTMLRVTRCIARVGRYCGKMLLSSRYLVDGFKLETGKSGKDRIQLFVIDKAKFLLVKTPDSITKIAYTLGFDFPQYFVRGLKRKWK